MDYDAWLEAPYQAAAKWDEDCERVAERLGLSEDEAADFDYDTYFEDLAVDHAENLAEDYWLDN